MADQFRCYSYLNTDVSFLFQNLPFVTLIVPLDRLTIGIPDELDDQDPSPAQFMDHEFDSGECIDPFLLASALDIIACTIVKKLDAYSNYSVSAAILLRVLSDI